MNPVRNFKNKIFAGEDKPRIVKGVKKSVIQSIWDFLGLPLRTIILNEKMQKRLRVTAFKEERLKFILPLLEGKVLDIGCGKNELVNMYRKSGGEGIGVDIFPFEGVDYVVDTTNLPFEDGEFDTVTMIACLNHIPFNKRDSVLSEAYRVLNDGGRLLLTMIGSFSGWFCHKLCWWDFDQNERGIDKEKEDYGLSKRYIMEILDKNGFQFIRRWRFGYMLNNLFVFKKKPAVRE